MSFYTAAFMAEQTRLSFAIADRESVAAITEQCTAALLDESTSTGPAWLHLEPMLSTHEHAPQVIDMNTQVLAYARMRGLIQHHPRYPHLVRVTQNGRAA